MVSSGVAAGLHRRLRTRKRVTVIRRAARRGRSKHCAAVGELAAAEPDGDSAAVDGESAEEAEAASRHRGESRVSSQLASLKPRRRSNHRAGEAGEHALLRLL